VGILILAYYLKKRQDAKAASQTNPAASTAGAAQTFPNAQPMNISNDIFLNVKRGGPKKPRLDAQTPGLGPNANLSVSDWIMAQNTAHPGIGLTLEKLQQLNPNLKLGYANQLGFEGPNNPYGTGKYGQDVLVFPYQTNVRIS
jgi:hypothetical protein